MRTLLIAAAAALLAAGPGDDLIESENKATSVRKALPRQKTPAAPPAKAKPAAAPAEKAAPKADADDVKAIDAADLDALKAADGKEVTVRGRVVSTFVPQGGKVLILNFGQDHRKCFKVSIFERNFGKFDGKTAEAVGRKYDKKTVTVEGTVKLFKELPEITVNVPTQIKLK
jgi:hypothetical protein